jgi:hypothetical protein
VKHDRLIGYVRFNKPPEKYNYFCFSSRFYFSCLFCCIGGQGTSPNEQKTQQSPGWGLKISLHCLHSWKNWQASVGIAIFSENPHFGQVSVDSGIIFILN